MEELESSLTCLDILRSAVLTPNVHRVSKSECKYILFDITMVVEDCMTAYEGSFIRIFVNRLNDRLGWRISAMNIPEGMITKGMVVEDALTIQLDLFLESRGLTLTEYFQEHVNELIDRDRMLYDKLNVVYKKKVS